MTERKELRDHHATIIEFDIRNPNSLCYLIGTPQERQAFVEAAREANRLVSRGDFVRIGEIPDFICEKCLRFTCDDSPVRSGPSRVKRGNIYTALYYDEKLKSADNDYRLGRISLDQFSQIQLRLIDEWWVHPNIDEPNFIFSIKEASLFYVPER